VLQDVAKVRAAESSVLEQNGHMCGAVYLAGYVIECHLKNLLNKTGRPFPRSGKAGHNLLALWDAAGLRARDQRGHRKAFLEIWDTSLRYEAALPESPHAPKELLAGARELAGIVARRTRMTRGPRRGGGVRGD
jgi:hypothetical protein